MLISKHLNPLSYSRPILNSLIRSILFIVRTCTLLQCFKTSLLKYPLLDLVCYTIIHSHSIDDIGFQPCPVPLYRTVSFSSYPHQSRDSPILCHCTVMFLQARILNYSWCSSLLCAGTILLVRSRCSRRPCFSLPAWPWSHPIWPRNQPPAPPTADSSHPIYIGVWRQYTGKLYNIWERCIQ